MTATFDAAGQTRTTTDARNVTLAYTYDDLGRKTTLRNGSTTGTKRAEWFYDGLTDGIGQLNKSIRYDGTNQYVNEVSAFDTAGRPTGSKITIPSAEGALCAADATAPCVYSYSTTYYPNGNTKTTTLPGAAGLAKETLAFAVDEVDNPRAIASSLQSYLQASYTKLDQLSERILGATGKRTWLDYQYDLPTGRLVQATGISELKPEMFRFTYGYDSAAEPRPFGAKHDPRRWQRRCTVIGPGAEPLGRSGDPPNAKAPGCRGYRDHVWKSERHLPAAAHPSRPLAGPGRQDPSRAPWPALTERGGFAPSPVS